MLIPVLVEPTFTELHTLSVEANASGMDSINNLSAGVIALDTKAEYPPIKLTPTSFAALSKVLAIFTKSFVVSQTPPPTKAIGVTEILLFTIGIPYSFSISCPTETRFFALSVIFA